MRLFGSYTITFDSTDLGDTRSGVNINVIEKEKINEAIGSTIRVSWITHVSGVIHKFNCEAMSIVDDLVRNSTAATLIFTGIDHKITVTNATLSYPKAFNVGQNRLQSFDLRFFAMHDETVHDASNPILKLESV